MPPADGVVDAGQRILSGRQDCDRGGTGAAVGLQGRSDTIVTYTGGACCGLRMALPVVLLRQPGRGRGRPLTLNKERRWNEL